MKTIQYDTPIEVTERQYKSVMLICGGIVAGTIIDGKYFVKVWMMKYVPYVQQVLNSSL